MLSQKNLTQILTCCIFFAISLNQAHAAGSAGSKQHAQEMVSSKGFSYQIRSVPTFVDRLGGLPSLERNTNDLGDVLIALVDQQVSLLGQTPDDYVHLETIPLTSSALQRVSQVYITFNPAYQKLALHSIRIWRNGKAINLTRRVKLDLLRRENDLDKNIYEGNVTAVGVLPDTRVNDVIDVEYTVSGANPIFGMRYANVFSMTQPYPASRYRFSLVAPQNRLLKVQPPQGVAVKERREKDMIRYVIEKDHLKPIQVEDRTPHWYQSAQLVQVSEYQDWAQVGSWANDLFKADGSLSPEMETQIQTWKDANLPKDQLTVEVLRWVQSRIRYFGIELGVNSHLPAPPNLTVERKFGDCKDKSLLLATLLKALGIDAEPTLASLTLRRNVENMVPSPALFDHAIVRVIIEGKTYWLDPTLPPQYGKLGKLGVVDYGGVLVLGQNSKQLQSATYPSNYEDLLQVIDHFKVSSYGQPVQLTTQIKGSLYMAEMIRVAHDNQSKDEFNKYSRRGILRIYPKAQFIGDTDYVDDKINNQVTATIKCSIEDFTKYDPGSLTSMLYAPELLDLSVLPIVSQRTTPYALPGHLRVGKTIELEFPEEPGIHEDKNNNTKAGEFWTFTSSVNVQHQKLTVEWSLRANKEAVPVEKISEYISETRSIREQMGLSFRFPVGSLTHHDKQQIESSLQRLEHTYGNSTSGRVKGEKRNIVALVLTSRDIASGKLSGKQLAEAYSIRSVAYEYLNDVQHALEDIRAARELDPDNSNYIISEAETLSADGQFATANQLYEQAMQKTKQLGTNFTGNNYRSYGESLHFSGQNEKAKGILDEALRHDNGAGLIYAAIWKYIVSINDPNASVVLQSAMSNIQDRVWPYAVGEMFLGKITPEQLIETASSQDKGIQEDQYCEAYFYIGQKYLLGNNKEGATESFQKSVDQGVMPYTEYNFSLYELGKKKLPRKNGFLGMF